MWVFGYGSLVWRPGDVAQWCGSSPEDVLEGFVVGFSRRFWQASTDHRGVPGSPGRVVSLFSAAELLEHENTEKATPEEMQCWGKAYRIRPECVADALAYLDYREKGGYSRDTIKVFQPDSATGDKRCVVEEALVYRATPDNDEFLGSAPAREIAEQVN
jgi:glutathione-specific gamma-glutamylcyclotransferase